MSAASGPACGAATIGQAGRRGFRSRSFRPAPTTRPFYAQTLAACVNGTAFGRSRAMGGDPFPERMTEKQHPAPLERERGVVRCAARVSEYAGA
ncbi:hypothetical protein BCEP27_200005 [Burkholderia cepacia]